MDRNWFSVVPRPPILENLWLNRRYDISTDVEIFSVESFDLTKYLVQNKINLVVLEIEKLGCWVDTKPFIISVIFYNLYFVHCIRWRGLSVKYPIHRGNFDDSLHRRKELSVAVASSYFMLKEQHLNDIQSLAR